MPSLITVCIAKARGQHLCSAGPRSVTWPPALPPSVESVPPGGHEEFRLTPHPLVLLTTLNGLLAFTDGEVASGLESWAPGRSGTAAALYLQAVPTLPATGPAPGVPASPALVGTGL